MNASLDTYLAVLWALVQGSPPWIAVFVVSAVIVCAPNHVTRYRCWRRRSAFARRGGRS